LGEAGVDILVGSEGNDSLFGGDGDDVLVGIDPAVPAFGFGAGEIDTLTGGVGRDLFLLGDNGNIEVNNGTRIDIERENPEVYYEGGFNSDYALITDFTGGEDRIQLRSNDQFSGYSFGTISSADLPSGIGISFNNDLIAIVQGVSFFELFSEENNFLFV
jgi:Ca2+-binding RTX toxin-like protein